MAEMPWRAEEVGSARIKRKVCEAHDVSAVEAACLPQPLLALGPATRQRILRKAKDRNIASLCARTPFPSFIYLCPPAAGDAWLFPALFSVPLFHCRTVYVSIETALRFEIPALIRHRRSIQEYAILLSASRAYCICAHY